jgi:benzoate-CoA ligase family protein
MVPSLLDMPVPAQFNQADFLVDRHLRDGRGGQTAFHFRDQTITYAELAQGCNRAGNALRSLGVEREQRVAIVLPDRPELAYTYLGAMKIAAIPVPLNPLQTAPELAYCFSDAEAQVVVVDEQYLAKILDSHPTAHIVVVADGAAPDGALDYRTLVAPRPSPLETADTAAADMAFWMYSSGTTGRPKAVVHRHRDILFYQPPFAEAALGVTEDDVLFATSKAFFSYGRNASIEMPLLYGASAVLFPERPSPEHVLEAIARHRPTIFFSVPTFYSALMEHVQAAGREQDLSSLRLTVSSGEALPRTLFDRWQAMFSLEIVETLGSTDAGAQYLSNVPGAVKPGSAGTLLPTFESRLLDVDGAPVADGNVGTLHLKSRGTAPLYWNQPEQSAETFLGEWLNTGDLFHRDEDGYYWFVGRSNDMFKVRGMWVAPVEVENELLGHPSVLECAVVDAPDARGLMQAKAVVVTREGQESGDALAAELRNHLAGRVAPFKVPTIWAFADALPRTATGKVQRFALRG